MLTVFGAALALTAVAVPVVRRLARGGGLFEQPVEDRWHRRPVPKLGGVAMAAVFLVVGASATASPFHMLVIVPGLMFLVGLTDDLRPMSPATRFAAQFAAAGALLLAVPLPGITGQPFVDTLLSMFWFVGITNAFNLLDNIDGLAAGVAAIAGGFLVLSLVATGAPALVSLAVPVAAMTGVAAGFLVYNWHPASIFMGDGGSYLLGSFFASATIVAVPTLENGSGAGLAIAVVLLLVPCADTALVVLTRRIAGRSAFAGGRDHLSHRLVAIGGNDRRAVLVLYGVAVAGGLAALGLQTLGAMAGWALVGVYAVAVAAIGAYLAHVDIGTDVALRAALPLPTELTTRYRVYEIALDVSLVALAYYVGLVTRFRDPDDFNVFMEHFLGILPLVASLHLAGLWIGGKYRPAADRTGLRAALTAAQGGLLGSAASVIAVLYLTRFEGYSRQAFAVAAVLVVLLLWSELLVLRLLDGVLRKQRTAGRP